MIGLLTGAWFAACMTVLSATVSLPQAPFWGATLIGIGAGAAFGALAGPAFARAERGMWRAAGEELNWQQFRGAARASRSGRGPDDPRLREAAIRLGVYRLAQHRRQRKSALISCWSAAGFSVLAAVLGNGLAVLSAVWFTGLAIMFLHERTRLGKALLRLRAAPNE
ncbi:hypothetical protein A4R44_08068 [Amycolatopsis sp. M39]|nr:hypothetical protein A4R44_08068 [Amycolatopsis sp. M39]SFQ06149.1 hypothetical protein SAMN05421854_108326 [Amycolatopsis rubida]